MKDKILAQQEQIIDRLKSLLEIKYVFKSIVTTANNQVLFIVILKVNCSSLSKELSSMVAKIFQEETEFLYRIFSLNYAQQQLMKENLFFVHGCTWDKLIYQNTNAELDSFHEYYIPKKTLDNIQATFEKERHKMAVFFDGATFFIEKNNLSHATYMLHQYIELWFRYAALFTMGKERKSHNIKELQTYIKAFASELGNLFNTEIEEEQSLLKLLDDAYITTRYENNYHINLEKIHKILEKANIIESIITDLFKAKTEACHKDLGKQDLIPESISREETSSNGDIPKTNEELILDKIKKLSEEHYYTLKPNPHSKDVYNINLSTDGYLETSFMMANLLKVCIMALEADYIPNNVIQQLEHNVREVLGYILCMMPYEEMEFLDKVRDLLAGMESECQN